MTFLSHLQSGRVLILDGATGTELDRRGVDTSLPLWSARALIVAPDIVRQVHRDYLDAGADIITTNTFRTHRRTLTRAGSGERTRELTQLAVQLAREAIDHGGRTAYIAGSLSPLEDCYSPTLVPLDDELRAEHLEMARDLADAGCDLLLVETMNTIREAVIAAEAATSTGLPVCVSFVVGPNGRPPDQQTVDHEDAIAPMTLLSGETIAAAVNALTNVRPIAIMVNCVPLAYVDRAFDALRATQRGAIGLYANVGHADDASGWTLTDDVQPAAYARHARRWIKQGAAIVGGCCGTSPAHIAAIRKEVDK
ncbi:MAG: homocysteine S-methyltransferase family protein [Chloroflexi bacterium]|nr:homocysteine S-methyltransferase family protein [Chloroflexota bacterium]